MKKSIMGLIACLMVLTLACNASASLAQFTGHWLNADPNTRGVPVVDITASGSNVMVHAWGACTPTYCDWGNANKAYAYAPTVGSNLINEATAITAVWNFGFKDELMVIRPLDGLLQVDTFSVFAPGDGRTNYASRYVFYRAILTPRMTAGNLTLGAPSPSAMRKNDSSLEDLMPA